MRKRSSARAALAARREGRARPGFRRVIWSTALSAIGACLLLLVPNVRAHLSAFEIGGCTAVIGVGEPHCGQPIHEQITTEAIQSAMPNADQTFINDVNHGVQNTDLTHHFESEFHFDNSTASNGAFDKGFSNVGAYLQKALQEATICDPNGACRRNPRFLNPQHGTFTGIADDIVGSLRMIAGDPSCITEPACPTAGLATTAAAIAAEVLPTRADNSPDPDRTYKAVIGDVKFKVDESLGRHCNAFGRCFDRLEDMLTDRPTFQERAQHLRAMQQELLAYYAWQHLGHAFHGVQDFFAHSNYVELAAGKKGPPCASTVFKAELCDSEITGIAPDALPLPVAATRDPSINGFLDAFSVNGVRRALGASYDRLESGYYVTPQPLVCTPAAPLHYCHYTTGTAIGLNKDVPFGGGDANPSHKNHAYARSAAVRLSAQLWSAFLHDLPPDNVVAAGRFHSASPVVRQPALTLEVVYGTYNTATRKVTFTVTARDELTHEVKTGTVVVLGTNQRVQTTGATGRAIPFSPCKEFDTKLKRYVGEGSCTVRVTVNGYPLTTTVVDWQ